MPDQPTPRAIDEAWRARKEDYARHVRDLRRQTYEGAVTRAEREEMFRRAFNWLTPVACRVLEQLNETYLREEGAISAIAPTDDGQGGLIGAWRIEWPLLRRAKNRFTGEPLAPLAIHAIFPLIPSGGMTWTHPHLGLLRQECEDGIAAAWPMQVISAVDAERQEPILRVLAEAEMHQCTYLADMNWRILSITED